jgi:hypothetical protein
LSLAPVLVICWLDAKQGALEQGTLVVRKATNDNTTTTPSTTTVLTTHPIPTIATKHQLQQQKPQ